MGKKHVDKTSVGRSKRQKLTETEFWKEKGQRLWNSRCHGNPKDYSPTDKRRITVICEECGKKVQKQVYRWVSGQTYCHDCAREAAEKKRQAEEKRRKDAAFVGGKEGRRPTFWNTFPMFVIRHWDWTQNEMMPWEIGRASAKIVHATCPVCGKTYARQAKGVWHSLSNKTGVARCPQCARRQVGTVREQGAATKNLAEARPDVAAHWALEENGDLRPEQFGVTSKEAVYWIYDNGVVAKRRICDRTHYDRPDWSRPGELSSSRNSKSKGKTLADYPNLVEEFDDCNEGKPEDYTYGTARRVFWKCKRCGYRWDSQTKSRTILGSGCPRCAQAGISSGETHVRKALELLRLDYRTEHRFEDCRYIIPLPFDFVIFLPGTQKVFLAIEFQGRQHYEEIEIWGGKEGYEKRLLCDQIKRDWCEKNGVRLLEIPYTVDSLEEVMRWICWAF